MGNELIERRRLMLMQGFWKTVTGLDQLVCNYAIKNKLKMLVQYGKCEHKPKDYLDTITQAGKCVQSNLPQGYTELDYIQSNGNQYINLDTALTQDDVIEIEFEITASQLSRNIFGYRETDSANNIMLFFGGTENRVFIDFNNSDYAPYRLSYDVSMNTRYKAIISKSRRAILAADGTVLAESTTVCPDTISCPYAYLFTATGTPAYNFRSACKVYSCVINGKRDLVGVKDASNTVEMYDKVSAAPFANGGTGSFTAGPNATPTPDAPMDIVINNGALRYSVNMANVNAQTARVGYYITSSGVVTADANNWFYQSFIPVKPNTTYTLSMSQAVYFVSISEYSTAEDSGFIVRKAGPSGSNTSLTITTESNTNYIRFGANINVATVTLDRVLSIDWMLNKGGTAIPYTPYVEGGLYVDGTPEVLTVSGKNLLDKAAITHNGFVTSSGAWAVDARYACSDYIPIKNGEAYIKSGTTASSIAFYDTSKTFVTRVNSLISFTAEYDGFVRVNLNTGEDDTAQFERGSTATDYEPYHAPQTASVVDLLGVGSYADTQEILSGAVRHNIGAAVLSSAWNWFKSSTYAGSFYVDAPIASKRTGAGTSVVFCTHAVSVPNTSEYSAAGAGTMFWGETATNRINFKFDDGTATVADFKVWLDANPVIVLYPLATYTTESVAAQSVPRDVDAVITYTAEVSDITITTTQSTHTTPAPDMPLDIVCNNGTVKMVGGQVTVVGTPEVLTVDGPNLYDAAGVDSGHYYTSDGVYSESDTARLSNLVPVKEGDRIMVTTSVSGSVSLNIRYNQFDTNGNWVSQSINVQTVGTTQTKAIIIAQDGFFAFSGNYQGSGYVNWSTVSINKRQTASVANLFAVSDYADTHELIHGVVGRKVGFKVFDGTEAWYTTATANEFWTYLNDLDTTGQYTKTLILCSHFRAIPGNYNLPDGGIKFRTGYAGLNAILKFSGASTVAELKAWLAAEKAAGTPVIMLFPLAAETTESITPSGLQFLKGTNIVSAIADITGLALSATYKASKK